MAYGMALCTVGSFVVMSWDFISRQNKDWIAAEATAEAAVNKLKRLELEADSRDKMLKIQQDLADELKKKKNSSWWSWFT